MGELCLVGYTYRGYEMAYAFERAQAFGYHGIELRDFQDIDLSCPAAVAASLDKATKLADSHGLNVCSVFYSPVRISRRGEIEEWGALENVKLLPNGFDWNIPVRFGDINYRVVLQALKDVSYTGPYGVEYCGTGDPDVFAENDAHYLMRLMADLGIKPDRPDIRTQQPTRR